MKKTRNSKRTGAGGSDLLKEYRFDYSKSRPNRFANQSGGARRVVVLDPDVAQVFKTPDAVNQVLRALIDTMPRREARKQP